MTVQRPNNIDLYIVGAGVSFPEHLTLQTLDVLAACRTICSNLPQSDLDLLPEHLRARCTTLWPLYQDSRDRSANYNDVTWAVIEAVERMQPVAWLTPGHPLIFDSVSQALLQEGLARKWNVSVLPAISSIDTVLAQLGYDPAHGLVVYEATALVAWNMPLVPHFATLLLQPSAFGTSNAHYGTGWSPNLDSLRDHLRQYFPDDHQCAFVRSHSPQTGTAHVEWWPIGEMTGVPFDTVAGSTLFVPGYAAEATQEPG